MPPLFIKVYYRLAGYILLLSAGDKGFDSAFKDTAFNKNPVLALKTLNADIGTESDHLPLIAAAGVFFLEANHVAQLYL